MTALCPACSSADIAGFFAVDSVPANSCLLLESEADARTFPRGRLDLAVCRGCGFITNRAFEPALTEYSTRYEETQAFSPTFVEFGKSLAKRWVDRYRLHGAHVLEIGCGKGEFLVWMVEAGAGGGTGIDPGVRPERLDGAYASRIEWIADRYDARSLHLQADAIVCRHTLEHIAPVHDFLTLIRRHIAHRDVPVLFEVPDTRRVLQNVAFWDIYYEHCSYFTAGSVARLFRRCGFEVLNVAVDYGDQYLLIEARPAADVPSTAPLPIEEQACDVLNLAVHFAKRYDEMVATWSARLAEIRSRGGNAVLWGGGSKAVSFLSAPSLSSAISRVVDINPHKQGRFLAGTGHEVVAPDEVQALRPDLVVVANPVYLDEIGDRLAAMGVTCEVKGL